MRRIPQNVESTFVVNKKHFELNQSSTRCGSFTTHGRTCRSPFYIIIPFWTGTGPNPTVKGRMDFGGAVMGDFVCHCHFNFHSDFGMMSIIRVLSSRPLAVSARVEMKGLSGMQRTAGMEAAGSK